jgi:hypothetical protein
MFEFNRILKKSVLNRSKFKWFTYLYFPIAFVLILRNGINFWGYDKYALEWVKVWPKPVSVFSVENSGNLFLAKIFGVDSRFSWIALHISLTVVFFILLFFFISIEQISDDKKRTILFLIIVSPITMLLMQEIGYYDVVTMIGSLILAFGKDLTIKLLGTLVLCAGNTPQALVITLLFAAFLYSINSFSKKSDFRIILPFLFSLTIWTFQRFWLNGSGRVAEYNYGQWSSSFEGFLIASPLFLYALLGPLWLISPSVLDCLKQNTLSYKIRVFVCLLLVPSIFGIFTTDSTRDALCIMAPILFWLLRYLVIERGLMLNYNLKIMLCLAPCFLVWREGQIISPWEELSKIFAS